MQKLVISISLAFVLTFLLYKKQIMSVTTKLLTRSEFIAMYAPLIKKVTKGTGLFPSLMIAQAILESADKNGNAGNSGLTKKANNFFGIKADKNWHGQKIEMNTREVIEGREIVIPQYFRKYNTPEESFRDRVKFLQENSRYTKAGVFSATTPEAQAQALKNAGYATDPNYATILSKVIHNYSLKLFDL